MTIPDLLSSALSTNPGRPFVTFYDEGSGERVELSVTTTANWVAKTANMLQDTFGVDDSSVVHLDLPIHWETMVWLLACWSAGCAVSLGDGATGNVAVVGPDGWDGAEAEDVVALSLRPLGARFTTALPPGVMDFNAEVLAHGDRFSPYYPPGRDTTALVLADGPVTHQELVARNATSFEPGARALLVGDHTVELQADALVAALTADGSLVLVRSSVPLTDERRSALVAAERVTVEPV